MFTPPIKIFYDIYQSIDYGYNKAQLQSAEARLGITLPKVVRTYYRTLAKHEPLNHSHNRLLTPDELHLTEGYLILYEENQGVYYWDIQLGGACFRTVHLYGWVMHWQIVTRWNGGLLIRIVKNLSWIWRFITAQWVDCAIILIF